MAVEFLKSERGWSLALSGIVDIFDAATLHATALEIEQSGCSRFDLDLCGLEAADTSSDWRGPRSPGSRSGPAAA